MKDRGYEDRKMEHWFALLVKAGTACQLRFGCDRRDRKVFRDGFRRYARREESNKCNGCSQHLRQHADTKKKDQECMISSPRWKEEDRKSTRLNSSHMSISYA